MPTKIDESPQTQQDRDGQPGRTPRVEVRGFYTQARGTDANHDAGYDIEPTPIGDADINTLGSER